MFAEQILVGQAVAVIFSKETGKYTFILLYYIIKTYVQNDGK